MTALTNAAEANREFYANAAQTYDTSEDCIVDPRLTDRLRETLRFAVSRLHARDAPRALDACGGSGNASLMLLQMGITPLTADISPHMLAIYESKARAAGYVADTIVNEIAAFLRADERTWDLIVFSSALHHLDDYCDVMRLAMDHVAPGGVIVTIFDPTLVGRLGLTVRAGDYVVYLATHDFTHFLSRLRRRMTRLGRSTSENLDNVGSLAERHALTGVDDAKVASLASDRGWEVLRHVQFYEARFQVSRRVFRALRQPSSFSMVLRSPTPPAMDEATL